jgi:hypothetical protein
MYKKAFFNQGKTHRFSLLREWDPNGRTILFIGLNPSMADDVYDDPTIRRVINFAKSWKFGRLYFANLFSFKTPDPKVLLENLPDAILKETDNHLKDMISRADRVVVCWGSWAFVGKRAKDVLAMIPDPYCFGKNMDGQPKHPLYLKANTELIKYERISNPV